MNKLGFLIGNGTSRAGFNLESLRQFNATIVGCNTIWEDFTPDIIVAIDNTPANNILDMQDREFKLLHRDLANNMMLLDEEPTGWPASEVNNGRAFDSGIVGAAYLASQEKCKNVVLIGVDFFRVNPMDKREHNDIYGGRIKRNGRFGLWNRLANFYDRTTFTRIGAIPEYDIKFYSGCLDRKIKLKEEFDASDFI